MEESNITDKKTDRPWLYKKGQSGNPKGRPPGVKSLKQWTRERLLAMTDEERDEFMNGLPKEIIWKMAEGNPKQDVETDIKGELVINISEKIAQKLNDTPPDTESSS